MKSKKFIVFGVIVAAVVVFAAVAIKNKPDTEANIGGDKEGTRVTVEYVKEDSIDSRISSSGKLEAVDTKTLFLEATNKIAILHKEVGDQVKAGEVVITLDKEAKVEIQNQLDALAKQLSAEQKALEQLEGKGSQSEILSAQATLAELTDSKKTALQSIKDAKTDLADLEKDLKDKEKDLATNEELLAAGAISQKTVDDLKDAISDIKQSIEKKKSSITLNEESLSTVDAKIKNAQYRLDLLQNKVSDSTKAQQIAAKESTIKNIENQIETGHNNLEKSSTEIVAPIDGVITYIPEEEGMTIAGGSKILSIVDPTKLKVKCAISPYYAPDLRLNLDAVVKYTGSKTLEVPGKVTKIAPVAETEKTASGETTTLPVEVSVTDPGSIIKPGFSVDVKIITDTRENVCIVPILAIQEEDDLSYVYVVHEDGSLEKREVVQGLSSGLNIEVSNVEKGEMIVSTVEDYLEDGMKVSYEKIGDAE